MTASCNDHDASDTSSSSSGSDENEDGEHESDELVEILEQGGSGSHDRLAHEAKATADAAYSVLPGATSISAVASPRGSETASESSSATAVSHAHPQRTDKCRDALPFDSSSAALFNIETRMLNSDTTRSLSSSSVSSPSTIVNTQTHALTRTACENCESFSLLHPELVSLRIRVGQLEKEKVNVFFYYLFFFKS